MTRKYPYLSSPIQIGNAIYRNRMASAPTGGTDMSPEGHIGQKSIAFYELKAKGGAAVVPVCEVVVHRETDDSPMFLLDSDNPAMLGSFTYAADAIRRHGAIPSIELSHGGRYAFLKKVSTKYGPSAGTEENGSVVLELTHDQIRDIVAAYGHTAALAKRAGFEMIMIHGGHGWLINQFLSPFHNIRTDGYGGSIENKCRFALEAIESVRNAVGPGFPIEFRLSGRESFKGGYELDTAVKIAEVIAPHIDLLHVSAGSHHLQFDVSHPSMFMPHGANLHFAEEIKKHVSVPVATVGNLGDPAKMEEIIASGKADVVYMARALLADPYLPRKIMENRDDEIIQCLRCYVCNMERGKNGTRRCTLNPLIGREADGLEILPARVPRKVLVAGGGPGGMEAALISAQRGHKTILCEKADRLGGILNCEEGVSFKEPMFNFTKTMERLLAIEGVEVRLNTEVTSDYAEKENADVLICAVGSEAIIPPIPGIDGGNVIPVLDLPGRRGEIGDKVVVLGGGQAGCETAIHLANEGKSVVIVEMLDKLASDSFEFQRDVMLEQVYGRVDIKLGYKGIKIDSRGLYCKSPSGEEELIAADTIIISVGQSSRRCVVDSLLDAAPRVMQIGDCVKPKDMTVAIYQGFHAALDV